jgi:hypothetical protein
MKIFNMLDANRTLVEQLYHIYLLIKIIVRTIKVNIFPMVALGPGAMVSGHFRTDLIAVSVKYPGVRDSEDNVTKMIKSC